MTQANTVYPRMPLSWPEEAKDFTSTAYNLGPYAVETTQRHTFGRRAITWDGRVFKYAHSVATVYPGYGAFNLLNATVARLINSVTPAAISIGDRTMTMTVAATEGYAGDGIVAQDELRGGYIVLGHGAAATTENRCILANTAVASGGGTTTLTLDAPFAVAHAAGVACECPGNPYHYVGGTSTSYSSVMGVPVVELDATYNGWIQTWGPCWCVPGGGDANPGDTASDRTLFFVGDGSVNGGTALTVETGYQLAGFMIDTTASGTAGMPLVMLQISI
jgi:hypothetical protein